MDRSRIAHAIEVLKQVRERCPRRFYLSAYLLLNHDGEDHFYALSDADRQKAIPMTLHDWKYTIGGDMVGWIASDPSCIQEGLHLECEAWGNDLDGGVRFGGAIALQAVIDYFEFQRVELASLLVCEEEYKYPGSELRMPPRGKVGIDAVMERLELLLVADEETAVEMIEASDGQIRVRL